MKFPFLKIRVMLRRFRHGLQARYENRVDYGPQLDSLLGRADADAAWHERANWMIDVSEWLRHQPKVVLSDAVARRRQRHQRLLCLLDWLDVHKELRRQVQTCLQRTLREAGGAELFSVTGLPHEAAFFSELMERAFKRILPRHLSPSELSNLFAAMFPHPDDAQWLLELDPDLLARLWKLVADDGITHTYWQQTEEALTYLTNVVLADGISPAFRQRLDPYTPLQATPFMALRREIEIYLRAAPHDEGALRSARMLIAVCQAQTDRIYAHLDEYGVSVGLVYRLERMRAQLTRMGRLIDMRAAAGPGCGAESGRLQMLLADLIAAHHYRSSVRSLVRRSFVLLARKMVERNADHGEHYIARDSSAYRAMLKAACLGGIVTAATVLVKILLTQYSVAHFFEGVLASLNYVLSFLLIAAIGGVLATKQPAVTAPALAAKMGELDSVEGLHALLVETSMLLRSQAAAVFGNLAGVIPTMLLIVSVVWLLSGATLMSPAKAQATLQSLSLIGPTPLYAAVTGVLLWISSLAAGFADNWFAWRRLREALAHQRRLVHALGAARAARWACWLERQTGTIAGNLALGIALGMTPVLAQFFGLPLDVRHVTLASGSLVAATSSLGWHAMLTPGFWLAVSGIVAIGILNVAVSFACAMLLALRAREIPARIRRLVFRAVLRRMSASPLLFFFPEKIAKASASSQSNPEQDP